MDPQPSFGPRQLLSHVINDMAWALCQRPDEPQPRQLARAQAAAESILTFQPGDAIEAMIAGHCVMFHELIVDGVQNTLRGEPEATRRATRSGIVAMDKAFGANLVRLEKYRARQAATTEDTIPAEARAETGMTDRSRRHESGTASTELATEADQPEPAGPQIPGVDGPRDEGIATVAQLPGLNRQARRAIRRQFGKRIDPGRLSVANGNLGRDAHS
jgi:hypothetical protein